MSRFYSHIVEIESIVVALDGMDLSAEQKSHLAGLVDSTIHHTVLDIIFSKLSEKDKAVFAARLKANPDDKELMKFLNDRVEGIEEEIAEAVKKLKEELHEDIKEAKKK